MRFRSLRREVRQLLAERHPPQPPQFERYLHDPEAPGAWRRLLAAVRDIRKRGARAIVRVLVSPSESPPEPAAAKRPSTAPAATIDTAPARAQPRRDPFAHFATWSIRALEVYSRREMPAAERNALEDALNAKLRDLRDPPPLTPTEAEAAAAAERRRLDAERELPAWLRGWFGP